VEERAPAASERASWREAFVTNTVRMVHPIREIRWPRGLPGHLDLSSPPPDVSGREHQEAAGKGGSDDRGGRGGSGGGCGWDVDNAKEVVFRLPDVQGPVTKAILARVLSSLAADVGPAPGVS
jgi:hypothetical protein